MRVLICGGRQYGDLVSLSDKREHPLWALREAEYRNVHQVLHELTIRYSKQYNPDDNWLPTDIVIIEGDAPGADSAAADFAVVHFCQLETYPAQWSKYGAAAGPIRNKQMLDEGKPDLVVAFPGGKGTANMVRLAQEAGVEVMKVGW
jgi:hypothetical protein